MIESKLLTVVNDVDTDEDAGRRALVKRALIAMDKRALTADECAALKAELASARDGSGVASLRLRIHHLNERIRNITETAVPVLDPNSTAVVLLSRFVDLVDEAADVAEWEELQREADAFLSAKRKRA